MVEEWERDGRRGKEEGMGVVEWEKEGGRDGGVCGQSEEGNKDSARSARPKLVRFYCSDVKKAVVPKRLGVESRQVL